MYIDIFLKLCLLRKIKKYYKEYWRHDDPSLMGRRMSALLLFYKHYFVSRDAPSFN